MNESTKDSVEILIKDFVEFCKKLEPVEKFSDFGKNDNMSSTSSASYEESMRHFQYTRRVRNCILSNLEKHYEEVFCTFVHRGLREKSWEEFWSKVYLTKNHIILETILSYVGIIDNPIQDTYRIDHMIYESLRNKINSLKSKELL